LRNHNCEKMERPWFMGHLLAISGIMAQVEIQIVPDGNSLIAK